MKKIIISIMLLGFIVNACHIPSYLPEPTKLGEARFGSYIKVSGKYQEIVRGELIALDSTQIIVKNEITKICQSVPMTEVKRFKLLFADPPNYTWSTPILGLISLSHGFGLIVTLPLNIVVTTIVNATGRQQFTFNHKDLTFRKLKMYARFPQGIPPNIDLTMIK